MVSVSERPIYDTASCARVYQTRAVSRPSIIGKSVYTQTNNGFTESLTRKKKNKKIAAKKTAGIGFLQQPIETVDALGYFL